MDPIQTPITGDNTLDHVLAIIGALVPLLSALASFVNSRIRVTTAAGETPSKALLTAGSILNFASVNIDKGVQFAQMVRGKAVPHTAAPPSAPSTPIEPPKVP